MEHINRDSLLFLQSREVLDRITGLNVRAMRHLISVFTFIMLPLL